MVNRGENGLLQRSHPATLLALILVQVVLTLEVDHPAVLLVILAGAVAMLLANGGKRELLAYGGMAAIMMIMILLINPLVNRNGATLLWQAPRWPLVGGVRITLEALVFGGVMAVRIAAVILLFALFNLLVHPDRVMALFTRLLPKSGLTLALTVRLIPNFQRQLKEITQVQLIRGVDFDRGGLIGKVRRRLPLLKVLILSSLEDSLDAAEAMRARGYGAGRRTFYHRERFGAVDMGMLVHLLLLVGWTVTFIMANEKVQFFPYLLNFGLNSGQRYFLAVMAFLVFLPAAADWGWHRWLSAKSGE